MLRRGVLSYVGANLGCCAVLHMCVHLQTWVGGAGAISCEQQLGNPVHVPLGHLPECKRGIPVRPSLLSAIWAHSGHNVCLFRGLQRRPACIPTTSDHSLHLSMPQSIERLHDQSFQHRCTPHDCGGTNWHVRWMPLGGPLRRCQLCNIRAVT
jgi:hypothetical protein